MAFRIRSGVYVDEEGYESKEKLYREHLAKFNKNNNRDLWKFFYWDFFHDGWITKIEMWEKPGDVVFHITCPNIKKKNGESFDFIDVDFKCIFQDVVYFHMDHPDPEALLFKKQVLPFGFVASEINTLTEILERKKIVDEDESNEFYSLVLELEADHPFELELVFSEVDVKAAEKTAFQLMLASDHFFVPIYNKDDGNFDKMPKWALNWGSH